MHRTKTETAAVSTTCAIDAIKDAAVKDAVSRSPIIKPSRKAAKTAKGAKVKKARGKAGKAAKPATTRAAKSPKVQRVTKTAQLVTMLQRPATASRLYQDQLG